jgi:predicted nucleotidyltransferase
VTFGEALARRRKAAALTQAQLARRVGTSQGRISSYESGRLIPSPASQDRLLRAARRLPSQVLDEKRDEVKHLAASERLLAVRVFGSVARGDDTLSSDIDLLVTPAPEATLLNLARFQIGAESLTGYQVDVVTDRGLDPSSDILAGALEL